MLRLEMLPERQQWCFVRPDGSVVVMGLLRPYRFRCDAVKAARASGLSVTDGGAVRLCCVALDETLPAIAVTPANSNGERKAGAA